MRQVRLGAALGLMGVVGGVSVARDARACGGCFHPPSQTASDITDERMLLSVSPTQTTLYDQLRYTGSPTSFAWVLPIHGTVQVGLSADLMFDSVDALTATQINGPFPDCPGPPADCPEPGSGAASGSSSGGGAGAVTVLSQENVGPYDTVQLHADDSSALNAWLSQNGFAISADALPVIDAYVTAGFDFLAMKLLPTAGVQAMRPVRVTTPGASLSLPLRMAAIGTGATVGITIWVISDGRYEPQNFPFFHIDDSALVWDFSTESSNYTTLRAQDEAALGGKGWEIESSISLNEELLTDTILNGGQVAGGVGSGSGSSGGGPTDASQAYLPTTEADGGAGETAEEVRTDDINALFAGMTGPNVRVTRMRSDIAHAAMSADFVVQASADQSELSNVRNVTKSINEQCPIYSNCTVVGTGSPAAAAPASGTTSAGAANSKGCAASAAPGAPGDDVTLLLAGLTSVATGILVSRRRARRST